MAQDFAKSFYNSAKWRKLRETILNRDLRICQKCKLAPAEHVHHITPITPLNIDNPEVTLNPNNLISLCKNCHDFVHQVFAKKSAEEESIFDEEGNFVGHKETEETKEDEETQKPKKKVKVLNAKIVPAKQYKDK